MDNYEENKTCLNGEATVTLGLGLDDGVLPAPPPDDRDAASAGRERQQRQKQLVNRLIDDAEQNGAILLDLSHKSLKEIPESLLKLQQLQYLYLEGNQIQNLPDSFFDDLGNLKWLDLRRNYLSSLPSAYIGSHQNLRTILLESNNLRTLPLELGLIPTLVGLNIANNPLEFPPEEIIEKGAQGILQFFRDMLQAKTQGKLPVDALRLEDLRLRNRRDSESSADSTEWDSKDGELLQENFVQHQLSQEQPFSDSETELASHLLGPVHHPVALHKPKSYIEQRQTRIEKLQKAGALGQLQRQSSGSRRNHKVIKYQEPLTPEVVEEKRLVEQKLAKVKAIKEKQDLIIQRRKDNEMLKSWRDESKKRQRNKFMTRMSKQDYTEPVLKAPFDIDQQHLRILTNEERLAPEVKSNERRAISPRTKLKMDQARAERDRELERKVKLHMVQMQERRRRPKGTPQEEMQAARKDLEIAEKLHRELASRRKELEYRFQAFTGGDI